MTSHILVKGKVQGVFFRATARDVAIQNNLAGWVRNTDEGHVELLVTGDEKAIIALENWCRTGPSHARVESVERSEVPEEKFTGFTIRR